MRMPAFPQGPRTALQQPVQGLSVCLRRPCSLRPRLAPGLCHEYTNRTGLGSWFWLATPSAGRHDRRQLSLTVAADGSSGIQKPDQRNGGKDSGSGVREGKQERRPRAMGDRRQHHNRQGNKRGGRGRGRKGQKGRGGWRPNADFLASMPKEGPVRGFLEDTGFVRPDYVRGRCTPLQVAINTLIINAEGWQRVLELVREVLVWMDDINMTTAVHRLATRTRYLPHALKIVKRDPIFTALLNAHPARIMSARQVGNMLWSMAAMEVDEPDLLEALFKRAAELLDGGPEGSVGRDDLFKAQELSNVAWSAATMKQLGKPVPAGLPEVIARSVMEFDRSGFLPQTISNMVWSFAILEFDEKAVLDCLAEEAIVRERHFNSQGIANTLWAFASLGYHHEKLFKVLGSAAVERLHMFKAQELSNLLLAYAKTEYYDWVALAAIDAAQSRLSYLDASCQVYTNSLWSYATLRYFPCNSMKILKTQVADRASDMKPQEISNTLWALARLGYGPEGTIRTLAHYCDKSLDDFTLMGLSNIIWALSVLQFSHLPLFRKLAITIIRRYQIRPDDLINEQLLQFFVAIMVARSEGVQAGSTDPLEGVEIPADLHALVKEEWTKQASMVTISYFQEAVGQVLTTMGWPHRSEHLVEDLFSVDIVLEGCSRGSVALECDGPLHFTANTRQPLGPFMLRQRLLKVLGWTVISVPFWEWSAEETEEDKANYILRKVRDAGIDIPAGVRVPTSRERRGGHVQDQQPRRQQKNDQRLPIDTSVDADAKQRGEEYVGTFVAPRVTRKGRTLPATALRSSGYNNNRRYERRAEPSRPLGSRRPGPGQQLPWSAQTSPPAKPQMTGKQMGDRRPVSALSPKGREDNGDRVSYEGKSDDRISASSSLERVRELQDMTVHKELKPLLREYGLRVSGTKQELVDRILEHELQHQSS